MKTIIFALFLVLVFAAQARAKSFEKVIGPLVLVERSYTVDLEKLKANCSVNTNFPSITECKVDEYPSNGSESLYTKPRYVNFMSEDGTSTVSFEATATGYTAVIQNTANDSKANTMEQAYATLDLAYKAKELDKKALTTKVQLVK